MGSRSGRGWRGFLVFGFLLAAGWSAPLQAQVRHEGASPDGRGGVVALAAGEHHTCAIRDDGSAHCWGPSPVAREFPPPPGPYLALAAGAEITCGLRTDGAAVCWGADAQAMAPPEGVFTQISVAGRHACGLRAWGEVECWGDGYYSPPWWGHFTALSSGPAHACGLQVDGAVSCWGANDRGQADVPAGTYTAVSAGFAHTCALRDSGEVACWGDNQDGQALPPPGTFTAIATGAYSSCGLRVDGRVQCWGIGGFESAEEYIAVDVGRVLACGLRTDGSAHCWDPSGMPAETPPPELRFGLGDLDAGTNETCHARGDGQLACWRNGGAWQPRPGYFTEVAGGDQFTCARDGHGLAQCWGDNYYGQLDVPPGPLHHLAAGRGHGCALKGDGNEVACWGWNSNGQAIAPAGPFRDVHAGLVHSCGVTASGEGRCWGYDGDGQAQVPSPGPRWLAIQAGDRTSCGLTDLNFVECWGLSSPEPVPTGYFRALSVGNNHSCAIRTDGRLACWGANWEGQSTPPEGTYVAVAAGEMHTCAIRGDGARVCWGAPWAGTPGLSVEPGMLPAARPNAWFHADLSLQAPGGYVPERPRFALVAGTLPPDFRFDGEYGALFGPTLAVGRYPITVEGRDANGFVARRDYVIVVDDTPPVIQPTIAGPLGLNGWYTGDVVLDWSVTDTESDMLWTAGCEHHEVLFDATDLRFHCSAESSGGHSERVVEIRRDSTPPHTALVLAETQGGTARFEFAGDDGLSGVGGFECRLDDEAFAACTSPFIAQVASGPHRFEVRALDVAGNRDPQPRSHAWSADATPPVIDVQVQGAQGRDGWYVGDVQLRWMPHDPDSPMESLVGCDPTVLATDSIGAGFTCTATSQGGTSARTVTVKRDATAPVIRAVAATPPNAAGWYREPVGVNFSCSDAASGVALCDDRPQLLEGEGAVVSRPQRAEDAAGNAAESDVVTANIDRTPPTVAPSMSEGTLLLNGTATVAANARDALSGIASEQCGNLVTGEVGNRTLACSAVDRAGHSATGSIGYRVVYGFSGFGAPVQNPPVLNLAKAGRSIPLRWRVLDAHGAPVGGLATAKVTAVAIACPGATENRINSYGGSNGELQNLGDGYYQLDWMAASLLRGSCRRLELDLGDGQPRVAQFKFN